MLKSLGSNPITYVGYTNNLKNRIRLHNLGKGAKFTRGRKWKLIYKEKIHSKNKINTFVAVFPTSKPKYILLVLLDEPKPNKDYIYNYRDGSGWKLKGTPYNTAGWTSVEVAGKIIEKIGPILAINKIDFYDNHVVKKSN